MLLPLKIGLSNRSHKALVLLDGEFYLICHTREHLEFKLEPLHLNNYNSNKMEQHNSADSATKDGPIPEGLALTKEMQDKSHAYEEDGFHSHMRHMKTHS